MSPRPRVSSAPTPREFETRQPVIDEERPADADPDQLDDIAPPVDAPFDAPEADFIDQRRLASSDDEAWERE